MEMWQSKTGITIFRAAFMEIAFHKWFDSFAITPIIAIHKTKPVNKVLNTRF